MIVWSGFLRLGLKHSVYLQISIILRQEWLTYLTDCCFYKLGIVSVCWYFLCDRAGVVCAFVSIDVLHKKLQNENNAGPVGKLTSAIGKAESFVNNTVDVSFLLCHFCSLLKITEASFRHKRHRYFTFFILCVNERERLICCYLFIYISID